MPDKPMLIAPGSPAPSFSLPSATAEEVVALSDFTGRMPLLLGLFRGVYCPFCRRSIAWLDRLSVRLAARGIATLGVVTTPAERARAYFRLRPTKMNLVSDPDRSMHRALGLPALEITEGPTQWPHSVNGQEMAAMRINPFGELDAPVPMEQAGHILDRKDGFEYAPGDQEDANTSWNQSGGLVLIDKAGVVIWGALEGADGPEAIGLFPSDAAVLAAVETVAE
jgi:peroxiredoxin